jgi:hypothetical protein
VAPGCGLAEDALRGVTRSETSERELTSDRSSGSAAKSEPFAGGKDFFSTSLSRVSRIGSGLDVKRLTAVGVWAEMLIVQAIASMMIAPKRLDLFGLKDMNSS